MIIPFRKKGILSCPLNPSPSSSAFGKYLQVEMVSPALALQSARNYRLLRRKGITVRKTIDSLIATFCIENEHELLHTDSDFDGYEKHLGLRVVHP